MPSTTCAKKRSGRPPLIGRVWAHRLLDGWVHTEHSSQGDDGDILCYVTTQHNHSTAQHTTLQTTQPTHQGAGFSYCKGEQ